MIKNFVLVFLCSLSPLVATISVLVPCYYGHAESLLELLDHLALQTKLPDEVVVSLSESHLVEDATLQELQEKERPFKLLLLLTTDRLSAGENRNRAFAFSSGDLLIYQDADDLPHHQRIEAIDYFFTHYELDHLIHRWCPEEVEKTVFTKKEDEEFFGNFNFDQSVDVPSLTHKRVRAIEDLADCTYITFGNVAVSRRAHERARFKSIALGEDILFTKQILRKTKNSLYLHMPLLLYRQSLSSPSK